MELLNRNELCWCKSGKEYEHCHREMDMNLIKAGSRLPDFGLIKTKEQIRGIKKSGALTSRILDGVEELVKPGITTNEIDEFVHHFTIENGGYPAPLNYMGFPKSVCTSINNVICHGIPSDKKLKEGSVVNIDVTTILDGYYSDASRMYTVGQVSLEADKLVECARECLRLGIESVKPYHSISDIGRAIEPYAMDKGYSVVRDFGGHGTGLEFHEEPFICHAISNYEGMLMLPGMVFTIEPMINQGRKNCRVLSDGWTTVTIDRSLSAQWEHTVLVTENGVEILTTK